MRRLLLTVLGVCGLMAMAHAQCTSTTCGENTDCKNRNGVAVCLCLDGYTHLPGKSTIDGCPVAVSARASGGSSSSSSSRNNFVTPFRNRNTFHRNRLSGGSDVAVRIEGENPCNPDPCGENTRCTPRGNRAVCACLSGFRGDPYTLCRASPCDTITCGQGAECEEQGNQAICRCPSGFRGDPFTLCTEDPCLTRDVCHVNADCAVITSRNGFPSAQCACRGPYQGDGYRNCYLDPCSSNPCGINAECTANGDQYECRCRQGYEGNARSRCNLNPCAGNVCGPNADCTPQGESARCSCRPGYVGEPASQQGCVLEPCSRGVCGQDAECESRGRSAICRCPRGYTGDPYARCISDPCSLNPCGRNALCENNGNIHVCKCPPDFYGNPNEHCEFDPCASQPCGRNTECRVSGDQAVCSCVRGYTGEPFSRSGCRADPCSVADICGQGAHCVNEGGRPACVCDSGYLPYPDPYQGCVRGECTANNDCNANQACEDFRCIDPCAQSCGTGADCEVRNHVAICKCPRGTTGDPFQNCRQFTRSEVCAACGPNTDCNIDVNTRTGDQRPICSCKQYYVGDPLSLNGCRHDCEHDDECAGHEKCARPTHRCQAVCDQDACGVGANCEARNHRAQCSCPKNYRGSPHTRCEPECTIHSDCADDQACVEFQCRDPCVVPHVPCGTGSDCFVRNHKAICSCPRGFTGDPFVSCREFTREDLCSPNPCGSNANCQPGFDRSGNDKPVCTCPNGFRGDPLISCRRGECSQDDDCRSDQACYNFRCENPCHRGQGQGCGDNAECRPINHAAVCACPAGYAGDPVIACRRIREGSNTRIFGSRFK